MIVLFDFSLTNLSRRIVQERFYDGEQETGLYASVASNRIAFAFNVALDRALIINTTDTGFLWMFENVYVR